MILLSQVLKFFLREKVVQPLLELDSLLLREQLSPTTCAPTSDERLISSSITTPSPRILLHTIK
jgi:hypothetical protein